MNDFNSFLRDIQKKEESAKRSKFNPEERIAYFKNLVADFFVTLESNWFKDAISHGLMTLERQTCSITEEALGQYYTEKCRIKFGGEIVDFIPIGTILLGTDARIDMVYGHTKVMFVHVNENVKGAADLIEIRVNGERGKKPKTEELPAKKVWKFTYANAHTLYAEATAQTVQQLIMDLVNAKA